jgi:threonine aldolase
MNLISAALTKRFAQLNIQAEAAIHRHSQLGMREELQQLSHALTRADSRDSYGQGGSVRDFEQQLSDLFALPNCVFLPTGTLAQCAALKCHSEQSGRCGVGLHPTSHLVLHEYKAIEQLWGLKISEMGKEQQVLSLGDVQTLDPRTTAAIIIETPMRELGGILPSWQDLTSIRAWCTKHDIKMHLDGARIWQTTRFYQSTLAQIASLFDSIYVSFYKDLGGISGAGLLGSNELITQARIWARRAGGNPITLYPELIAARTGLEKHLPQIPQYLDYTKQLCVALQSAPVTIVPAEPQAAMFHLSFVMDGESLAQKIIRYGQNTGIVVLPLPRSGDHQSCICEISIGSQAITQQPAFWAKHIQACLEQ